MNEKEVNIREFNNLATLKLIKKKQYIIPLIISNNELIICKLGFNSQLIVFPARTEDCKHIEVVDFKYLKNFIFNNGMCPVCGIISTIDKIYIDCFIKNIFSLIAIKEENFVIIN